MATGDVTPRDLLDLPGLFGDRQEIWPAVHPLHVECSVILGAIEAHACEPLRHAVHEELLVCRAKLKTKAIRRTVDHVGELFVVASRDGDLRFVCVRPSRIERIELMRVPEVRLVPHRGCGERHGHGECVVICHGEPRLLQTSTPTLVRDLAVEVERLESDSSSG